MDATSYGALGTDTNTIVKQGISATPQALTITPPSTAGYSQVYLVEAAYLDADTGSQVLPYYNSSNPLVPYSGPANSGTAQYTVRQGQCVIALKAGTAAPTGSQTTPATDPGYVPLYTITVINGQTQITTAQIITAPSAPFVPYNLNNLPFYGAVQDAGTVNAAVFTPPNGLASGKAVLVYKIALPNTGAMTVNGSTLTWADGSALVAGDWPASVLALIAQTATGWNLLSVMGPTVFKRSAPDAVAPVYITTSGSVTVPASATGADVEVIGGGGGGGGVGASSNGTGSGGGGGGKAVKRLTGLVPGATLTATIGAAGTAGASGGAGGSGGNSSLAGTGFTTITANGGGGGSANTVGLGGSGGTATGGDQNFQGSCGQSGLGTGMSGVGGCGGGCEGGASSSGGGLGIAGQAGAFPGGGGGGSGSANSNPGIVGGAGLIIIRWR